MTPRSDHRYFLPRHGLAFEAFWPQPRRSFGSRVRSYFHDMLFGGPQPGSPEQAVNPEAYSAALELVSRQELEAAAVAFTDLGYEVSIHPLRGAREQRPHT